MWAGYLIQKLNYRDSAFKLNAFENPIEKQNFYNRAIRLKVLMETYFYNMQGTLKKIEDVLHVLELILIENNLTFEVQKMPIDDSIPPLNMEEEFEDLLNEI